MWKFIKSAFESDTWLDCKNKKQICFWGRSNVGKSSLLNSLVKQKISFVSKQPGRTQLINYFSNDFFYIVDLPGYGYAQMSKENIKKMNDAIADFLSNDIHEKIVFLLIDSRTGITKIDAEKINFLRSINLPIHLIYTKIDKINQKGKSQLIKHYNELTNSKILPNNSQIFLASSLKNIGIDDIIEFINSQEY
ncbi:ribosome biogenesis GTP-binding protein YihA/YsxC [Mycoplasma tauri]|uniref:ribosome biogenesis GTP-binding protein YihA/YsxC n=1 Tax=Mycoplasma tauri TaxID=547987 RepID=UPI001966D6EB|nr:ribosome biogenesis GTP-binding protein YihA/YsxC [Mycoplasma tauri]MBZ4218498.1 ribosome biogenesis GTP-binding protein YihA/YsxC [Mycoplasma tauri]QSB07283.1 YihA family ribosome biogenesis GTP-binding protein [Mycoplasma tauri]